MDKRCVLFHTPASCPWTLRRCPPRASSVLVLCYLCRLAVRSLLSSPPVPCVSVRFISIVSMCTGISSCDALILFLCCQICWFLVESQANDSRFTSRGVNQRTLARLVHVVVLSSLPSSSFVTANSRLSVCLDLFAFVSYELVCSSIYRLISFIFVLSVRWSENQAVAVARSTLVAGRHVGIPRDQVNTSHVKSLVAREPHCAGHGATVRVV